MGGGGESDEKSDRIQYDNGLVFLSTWTTYFFEQFLAAGSCEVVMLIIRPERRGLKGLVKVPRRSSSSPHRPYPFQL